MRITYDPEADTLYIELKETQPVDSIDVGEGVTVDLDEAGHPVGLEILDARARLGADALEKVSLERLPLASASGAPD